MAPIRKGDGTALDPKSLSQIRKGDGTVLWNAMPDSALLHFPFGERTDSTLAEELEGANGTANGLTNVSGEWTENYAEDADGVDDYGDLGDWSVANYATRLTTDWGLALTIQTTDDGTVPFGTQDASAQTFRLEIGVGSTPTGEIALSFRDSTSLNLQTIGTGEIVNDGSKHRLLFGGDGAAASDTVCYLDGTDVTTVYTDDGDHSQFDPFIYDIYSHGRNLDGSADQFTDVTFDNIIPLGAKPTAQVATDDYNSQPWS